MKVVIGVLPDRPRGWRQISLSGRDWRLSYLDQNGDRRCMMVVSPSYYIFYDRVMTLLRQSTLCNNPRPTLCFSFNHDPPTSDCHPSPSPSNLPRFACEPPPHYNSGISSTHLPWNIDVQYTPQILRVDLGDLFQTFGRIFRC